MVYKLILTALFSMFITAIVSGKFVQKKISVLFDSERNEPEKYLDTLYRAMISGETFFIKVHAAEALIENGQPKGIESIFISLQKESSGHIIGSSRVLAKLNRGNPAKFNFYIRQILNRFMTSDSINIRLGALETLGKLGYYFRNPQIIMYAKEGKNGMKAMACWALSNSGTKSDEMALAKLLLSNEPEDYRYAAYAFRFKKNIRPASYALLDSCFKRLPANDPERIFIVSSLFVHALPANRDFMRKELLSYLEGTTGQQYLAADALGTKGTSPDISLLEVLLDHSNQDVRVAVANAILKIKKRGNK